MAKAGTSKTYSLILGTKYDAEIIGKLETVKSKGGYIKELIEKDITRESDDTGNRDNIKDFISERAERLIMYYTSITKEKYGEKYLNNNEKTITFQCNYDKCADIIDKLDSMGNKSEYVKNLVLTDIGLIDTNGERYMTGVMDGKEPRTKSKRQLESQREYARKYASTEEGKIKRREAQRKYAKRTGYAANIKWNKQNLKRIPLDVSLDMLESIDQHIIKTDESRNGFIKRAIVEAIERDNNS